METKGLRPVPADKTAKLIKETDTMKKVTVAATQMQCTKNREENIAAAEKLVIGAAEKGAHIVLLQELFENLYFCQKQNPDFFLLANSFETSWVINHFSQIAGKYEVVLPISFFEKKNKAYYNSVAVIDADGSRLGIYRKTHIPDGPGYQEKFYFNPGDTGFKIWNTRYADIGVGICWDQWFPEAARIMALMGAEILFYPTAIGSEPKNPDLDTRDHWQISMQGHSASNMVPVVAANRIGTERLDDSEITFYGSSFITGNKGNIVQSADRTSESIITHTFDLGKLDIQRSAWGVFRDRRPENYGVLLTNDGVFLT